MSRLPAAGLDMRAFRWPLLALERLREHERAQAAGRTSALQQEIAGHQQQLAGLEAARQAAMDALAVRRRTELDPVSHRQALLYLVDDLARLSQVRGGIDLLQKDLGEARRAQADAERGLASVRRMREAAQSAFALDAMRRQARLADLEWLARQAAVGVAPSVDEKGQP